MLMSQEPPTTPESDAQPPAPSWWTFARYALIGWAALGMLRFLFGLTGGYHARGLFLIPGVVEFIGCTCLLLGGIAAFAPGSRNTSLTIGAFALCLYAVLWTWFGGSVRSDDHLSTFLNGVQHVWFPVAVVILKVKSHDATQDAPPLAQIGSPGHLLLAAQLPGVAGMLLVGAMITGLIGSDPYGAGAAATLILTVCGSILSSALSLVFIRTSLRNMARRLAIAHIVYLVTLIAICAIIIATSKPRYHGGGGF